MVKIKVVCSLLLSLLFISGHFSATVHEASAGHTLAQPPRDEGLGLSGNYLPVRLTSLAEIVNENYICTEFALCRGLVSFTLITRVLGLLKIVHFNGKLTSMWGMCSVFTLG